MVPPLWCLILFHQPPQAKQIFIIRTYRRINCPKLHGFRWKLLQAKETEDLVGFNYPTYTYFYN